MTKRKIPKFPTRQAGDLLCQAILWERSRAIEIALANCPGCEVSGAMINNSNDRVCVPGHGS